MAWSAQQEDSKSSCAWPPHLGGGGTRQSGQGNGKTTRDPMSHRIIEKRRRDRMNNCLADLSRLIPTNYLKKGRGRIEKTEIIEMAIKHLKHLSAHAVVDCRDINNCHLNKLTEDEREKHFRMGFQECLTEAIRYLGEYEGIFASDGICSRLANHLEKFLEAERGYMGRESREQGSNMDHQRFLRSPTQSLSSHDSVSPSPMQHHSPHPSTLPSHLVPGHHSPSLHQSLSHHRNDRGMMDSNGTLSNGSSLSLTSVSGSMPQALNGMVGAQNHEHMDTLPASMIKSEEKMDIVQDTIAQGHSTDTNQKTESGLHGSSSSSSSSPQMSSSASSPGASSPQPSGGSAKDYSRSATNTDTNNGSPSSLSSSMSPSSPPSSQLREMLQNASLGSKNTSTGKVETSTSSTVIRVKSSTPSDSSMADQGCVSASNSATPSPSPHPTGASSPNPSITSSHSGYDSYRSFKKGIKDRFQADTLKKAASVSNGKQIVMDLTGEDDSMNFCKKEKSLGSDSGIGMLSSRPESSSNSCSSKLSQDTKPGQFLPISSYSSSLSTSPSISDTKSSPQNGSSNKSSPASRHSSTSGNDGSNNQEMKRERKEREEQRNWAALINLEKDRDISSMSSNSSRGSNSSPTSSNENRSATSSLKISYGHSLTSGSSSSTSLRSAGAANNSAERRDSGPCSDGGVPIFALHPNGAFYVPMTLDNSLIAPMFLPQLEEQYPVLHPVSIAVNFNYGRSVPIWNPMVTDPPQAATSCVPLMGPRSSVGHQPTQTLASYHTNGASTGSSPSISSSSSRPPFNMNGPSIPPSGPYSHHSSSHYAPRGLLRQEPPNSLHLSLSSPPPSSSSSSSIHHHLHKHASSHHHHASSLINVAMKVNPNSPPMVS